MARKPKFTEISSKSISFFSLVFILGILLIQAAASLFFHASSEEILKIDVVFRTSLSSIFGFIVSTLQIGNYRNSIKKQKNTIGFIKNDKRDDLKSQAGDSAFDLDPNTSTSELAKKVPINYQIITLSAICIFSLIILIVARNFSEYLVSHSATGITLSAFRDLVASSIGALIGLTKS